LAGLVYNKISFPHKWLALIILHAVFLAGPTTAYGATPPQIVHNPESAKSPHSQTRKALSQTSLAPTINFSYVDGYQYAAATGASVFLTQAKPIVAPTDYHSLAELAVQSADAQQIVEVGWIVAKDINGDSLPHLFVYHWVNGQPSCFNGCGYIQVSPYYKPGMAVNVGATGIYKINFDQNQWQIFYNGIMIGYFPASLWGGSFTQIGLTQTFGEVAASSDTSCTSQMGKGIFGSSSGSAIISGFALVASGTTPSLSVYQTNPSSYNSGAVNSRGFNFGGPGSCPR
jgi:hypothetical protein